MEGLPGPPATQEVSVRFPAVVRRRVVRVAPVVHRVGLVWLVGSGVGGCGAEAVGKRAPACVGSASPGSVEEMVDHLNSLPLPVTVPCLLDSLARPLEVELTDNRISAQPADGSLSPRIFVFTGDLVTALVPSGEGAGVLEFGEAVGDRHSRKGEVVVPVERELSATDPFTRIEHAEYGTVCAVCHIEQEPHPGGGTTSVAISPSSRSLVSVRTLEDASLDCGPEAPDGRCAVLQALFDGPVEHRAFPAAYPTIFELTE